MAQWVLFRKPPLSPGISAMHPLGLTQSLRVWRRRSLTIAQPEFSSPDCCCWDLPSTVSTWGRKPRPSARPDAALAYHPVAQVKRRTGGKWPPSRPFENSLHRGHCRGVWRGICEPPESGCRSRENTVCWGRVCGSYQCLRDMIQKGVENYEMIKNRACTVWFDVYGKPPKSG